MLEQMKEAGIQVPFTLEELRAASDAVKDGKAKELLEKRRDDIEKAFEEIKAASVDGKTACCLQCDSEEYRELLISCLLAIPLTIVKVSELRINVSW